MSVNTKKCRDFYNGRTVHSDVKADIYELCDEIDRLRKDLDFETRCMNNAGNTIKELQTELSQLREQLRPRSIKGEPPPKDKYVLVLADGLLQWIAFMNPGTEYTHWLPMPPAPPQPDAFEEWARARCADGPILKCERGGYVHTDAAKEIWNAAIQSTKGKV